MKRIKYSTIINNNLNPDLTLRKWDPVIINIMKPFELNNEVKKEISVFIEKKYLENIYNENLSNEISNILKTFKQRLSNKYDKNIKIINSYYNRYLNRIVYELDDGQFINSDINGMNIFTNTELEINMMINIFYSIADPIKYRRLKVQKIKNLINV